MTTTRETADHIGEANEKVTADHAELARLRQHIANLKLRPGHHVQFGTPSVVQVPNYWNRDLADDLEALLSEIAALRGELEASREEADRLAYGCDDARLAAVEIRAAQAERQRDEFRKAVRRAMTFASLCVDDGEVHPDDAENPADLWDALNATQIANQGADQ